MDENKLLSKIGELIDLKLAPIKDQLETIELKVEVTNKKIDQSQKDVIDTLSELIHTGYNLHEERIKKLEEHSTSHH
jgi:hypothetical protein